MAGWHHRLDGHEFGLTPGIGDGQGGLVCCDSWGRKESDTTETELNLQSIIWPSVNHFILFLTKTWTYDFNHMQQSKSFLQLGVISLVIIINVFNKHEIITLTFTKIKPPAKAEKIRINIHFSK